MRDASASGTWEPIEDRLAIPDGATYRVIETRTAIRRPGSLTDRVDPTDSVQYEIFRPLPAEPWTFWRDPDTGAIYCRTVWCGDYDDSYVRVGPETIDAAGIPERLRAIAHAAIISRLVPA